MNLISESYRQQNEQMHADPVAYGAIGHRWTDVVIQSAHMLSCHTILDYGAGKQTLEAGLRKKGWEKIVSYDPAIVEISWQPEPADLVACTDVLEHIEPAKLDSVLGHIEKLARCGVFIIVSLRPSRRTLPDGRNAHLILKDARWWMDRLMRHWHLRAANVALAELAFIGKHL